MTDPMTTNESMRIAAALMLHSLRDDDELVGVTIQQEITNLPDALQLASSFTVLIRTMVGRGPQRNASIAALERIITSFASDEARETP